MGFYTTEWKIHQGHRSLVYHHFILIVHCCWITQDKSHSFQRGSMCFSETFCLPSFLLTCSCHTRELNDDHSHIRSLSVSLRPADELPELKTFWSKDASKDWRRCSIQQTNSVTHGRSPVISSASPLWTAFMDQPDEQPGVKYCSNTLWVFPSHRPVAVSLRPVKLVEEMKLNWFLSQCISFFSQFWL